MSWSAVFLGLATVCLALPLEAIALSDEVRFPLADVVTVMGVVALFQVRLDVGLQLILAGLAAALVSVFVIAVTVSVEPRAFFSWAYYTKPHLALFAGVLVARRPLAMRDFLRLWSVAFGLFCFATGWLAVEEADRLREGYAVFGIPVFGAAGGNAFAVYLGLGGMLTYALAEQSDVALRERIWAGVVTAVAFALVVVSLSRQAALAVILFSAVVMLRLIILWPRRGLMLTGLATAAAVLIVASGAIDLGRWTDRLKWTGEGIENADLDLLTSGRTEIWVSLLQGINASPVFGTGFLGWAFPIENWGKPDWIEQGLSPHNQWLGALWRMGLLPGAIYLGAILAVVVRAMTRPIVGADAWTLRIIVLLVVTFLSVTQDVLTYPLSATLAFFLLGAMHGEPDKQPAMATPVRPRQNSAAAV